MSSAPGSLLQRLAHAVRLRLDEQRMIVEFPQLMNLRRAFPDFAPRPFNVFQVLPASGVRTKDGCHERKGPPHAVGPHLAHRVGQERMPVAIAPIDRQARPMLGQFVLQPRDQSAVMIVDGALAVEVMIVLGDFEQALAGHIPPAQNVFEKRHYVIRLLRPTERQHQHGVIIRHPYSLSPAPARMSPSLDSPRLRIVA